MEDLMYMVLGLVMFYSWIHGTIIISHNIKKISNYKKTVLVVGLVGFVLYVVGTL